MNSELNFKGLFLTLKNKLIYIIIITLVCGGIAAAFSFTKTPVYSVTATFYSVNVPNDYTFTDAGLVSAQQILVDDYIEIIKSDKMLTLTRDILKQKGYENISVGRIRSMMSAQKVEDTSVFTVSISGTDIKEIKDIITVICKNASKIIDETQQREHAIEVLSSPSEIKPVKVSPNNMLNISTGLSIGFFGSLVLFLIIAYFDRTVRTEEDLKNRFDIPIIGVIPSWDK